MFESLNEVKWAEAPQPKWNSPTEVPEALRALSNIEDEMDAQRAYHRLLYALGNDHAGTYYPVALWVVPFLGETLHHERPLVRETTLSVLLDLVGSFEPEPEFEPLHNSSGLERPLKGALCDAVGKLGPDLVELTSALTKGSVECARATELLSLIR